MRYYLKTLTRRKREDVGSFLNMESKKDSRGKLWILDVITMKLLLLILGFSLVLGFLSQTALFIAKSPSLDGKVFLVLKGSSYKKRDIIAITGFVTPSKTMFPKLLKKIVGIEGDRISFKGDQVFINNQLIGPVFKEASMGGPLTPLFSSKAPLDSNDGSRKLRELNTGENRGETTQKIPTQRILTKVIPKNCLFLAGTHPRSFDSRYKEFGLLCFADLPDLAHLGKSGSQGGVESSEKALNVNEDINAGAPVGSKVGAKILGPKILGKALRII